MRALKSNSTTETNEARQILVVSVGRLIARDIRVHALEVTFVNVPVNPDSLLGWHNAVLSV
jgi:hypothetical protein